MQTRKKSAIISFIFFCLVPLWAISLETSTRDLEKIENPICLTTSVIIPCHHLHAQFLHDTLSAYAQQTVLPDEVVISLSGTNLILTALIDFLVTETWPFKTKWLLSEGPQTEGKNRNEACQQAAGEIILCQDADDIPSPQRVEIVKYFFENYRIAHLVHSMCGSTIFPHYSNFESIKKVHCYDYDDTWRTGFSVGFGFCALRKNAFNMGCNWPDIVGTCTDLQFTQKIMDMFHNTVAIEAFIYYYYADNSSYAHPDYLEQRIQLNQKNSPNS